MHEEEKVAALDDAHKQQNTEEHKKEEVKVEEVPHEMVNKFLDAGDISRNSKSF